MGSSFKPLGTDDQARVCCDNCPWRGRGYQVEWIQDAGQRLDAGAEVPAGECPECGCLAYLARPDRIFDSSNYEFRKVGLGRSTPVHPKALRRLDRFLVDYTPRSTSRTLEGPYVVEDVGQEGPFTYVDCFKDPWKKEGS